jgi:hypothetical protein
VNPPVDFGTGESRLCIGAVSPAGSYRIAGDVRFVTTAYPARVNLTLTFYGAAACTGSVLNGLFAGYATHDVSGWQRIAAGPVVPDPAAVSARIRILAFQDVGADPGFEVEVDNVQVTAAGWLFAEDFEAGATCRWSEALP